MLRMDPPLAQGIPGELIQQRGLGGNPGGFDPLRQRSDETVRGISHKTVISVESIS